MQQRIINILFGVIIVMLTGTVVYLTFGNKSTPVAEQVPAPTAIEATTQTPTTTDETADWKTYTNDKLGLNFKIPKRYDVSVNSIKYSENGNNYDELVIYDVALEDASRKWQDKNRDPHSGIFPTRATMVCNSNQEFFLNEDVLIENIATKKQTLSSKGVIILEAEKTILKNGELSMRIYKYIDGDTGMEAIAYWENNKLYCSAEPVLPSNERLSDQQKQQRISEWEKILSTFEFTK